MAKIATLRKLVKAKNLFTNTGKSIKAGWQSTTNGAKKIPTIFKGKAKPEANLEGLTRQNFGDPTRTYKALDANGVEHEIEIFEQTSRRFGFFGKKYTTQTRFRKGEDAPISQVVKYSKGNTTHTSSVNTNGNRSLTEINKKTGYSTTTLKDANGNVLKTTQGNINDVNGLKVERTGQEADVYKKIKDVSDNGTEAYVGIGKQTGDIEQHTVLRSTRSADGKITSNEAVRYSVAKDTNGNTMFIDDPNFTKAIDAEKLNAFDGNLSKAAKAAEATQKSGTGKKITKVLLGTGAVGLAATAICGLTKCDSDNEETNTKTQVPEAKTAEEVIDDINNQLENAQPGDTIEVKDLPDGAKIELDDGTKLENGDKLVINEDGTAEIIKNDAQEKAKDKNDVKNDSIVAKQPELENDSIQNDSIVAKQPKADKVDDNKDAKADKVDDNKDAKADKVDENKDAKVDENKDANTKTTHTVVSGDNLWNIARDVLRDKNPNKQVTNGEIFTYWQELKRLNPQLNRGKDFNLIYPGDKVKLAA